MTQKIGISLKMDSLPSYKNPPVNEVVCGVRFRTPEKLRIPHIGILWEKFRLDYPIIQHAPPITAAKSQIPVDNATGLPLPRIWFINKSDDQLIQFQLDQFYFNWRRRENEYPRYPHVIENFENLWATILDFFNEFDLGELKPIEYQLSYINHIPRGQGWNTIDDLSTIFSDFVWRPKKGRFLPNPENVSWHTKFKLPEEKGFLNINLKQAIRFQDRVPLLVLTLTARGLSESTNKNSIREWFDVAHEWIVRGFADLIRLEVQREYWEKIEDA